MNADVPEIVIRPNAAWAQLDWRGLVAYRDLLWVLVRRDFVAKHRQTILGPIWFILHPLMTTLVFTLVFNRVMRVPTDGVPPMLFYLCGMLGWGYFSSLLGATGNSLASNAHLFSKVYFPRFIPPLAVALSNLLPVAIQLLTFLIFYARHQFAGSIPALPPPNFAWLLFLPLMLQTAVLGLGVGLLLSALTAKYRDLHHLLGFIVQLWLYMTPVIYPFSRIPPDWRWLAALNPMTAIVDGVRAILLGVGVVTPVQHLVSVAFSLAVFAIGFLAYQRTARTFVDTV
jgi:lipopolysaccharide transport system permease protein